MKPIYLFIALFSCLSSLSAQLYQPVHSGAFYSLQDNGNKIYHLEANPGLPWNGDTLYYFNRICRERNPQTMINCGGEQGDGLYMCDVENVWADYMRKTPTGEYFFVTKDSQEFYLPVDSLSGTFTFHQGASGTITGSYTNTLYNVNPLYPTDSVRVFSLSNGEQIHVSSHHGMFQSFDFMGLTTTSIPNRSFTRAELVLPPEDYSFREPHQFYDLQPGDVRVMYKEDDYMGMWIYMRVWTLDTVLSVTPGPTSTAVTYQRKQLVDISPTMSSNLDTTYWTAGSVQTVNYGGYGLISNEHSPSPVTFVEAGPDSDWSSNYSQYYNLTWMMDTCRYLNSAIDLYVNERYTYPYGLTYRVWQSFSSSVERLLCFSRGPQTWGTCPNWGAILSQEEPVETSVEVYPNPGRDQVVLRSTFGGELEVEVLDLRGAVVANGGGIGPVTLDMSDFADGVYVLRITSLGRTMHEKWIKSSR